MSFVLVVKVTQNTQRRFPTYLIALRLKHSFAEISRIIYYTGVFLKR